MAKPAGLAVDVNGNVCVGESAGTNDRLLKETLQPGGGYVQTAITSGLNSVFGVAVDGNGNVYHGDGNGQKVYKETLQPGGSYAQSVFASSLGGPWGLTLDGEGDVYVSTQTPVAVYEFSVSSPPGLAFVPTTVGQTSPDSPQVVTLENSGNATLSFTIPGSGNNPSISANFTLDSSGATACPLVTSSSSAPGTLAANGSCTLPISFSPTELGRIPGTLVLMDNNLNGAVPADTTQTINLTGTGALDAVPVGTSTAPQPDTFNFSPPVTLGSMPFAVLTEGIANLDFQAAATQPANVCVAGQTYNAGNSCAVNVTFTPTEPGIRHGAVVLYDSTNAPVMTEYVQGTGVAPLVVFPPGAQSVIVGTGLSSPHHIAVDAAGNVYITDSSHGRALKETLQSNGTYVQSVVVSGLGVLTGIAVDGAGNVFVVDTGNGRMVKMTLQAGGGYAQSVLISSGLAAPGGVAVDGSGNFYIGDYNNDRVLKETLQSSGSYAQTVIPGTGLNGPEGVAVDGDGDVFVADSINNRVVEEALQTGGTYVQSTIVSGLNDPLDVAVDDNENIYIADLKNNRILEEALQPDGTYVQSVVLGTGLSSPGAIALDGSGNIFISDTGNNRVLKLDQVDAPSLSFAATSVGSTSSDSPRTVTLLNYGNVLLDFPVPATGGNPSISTNFTLNSSGATACPLLLGGDSTGGVLAANATCTLSISFSPTLGGGIAGTLVSTDNSLDATSPDSTQTVNLNGTGVLITIAPSTLSNGTYGTAYTPQTLTASGGGTAPYTFAVTTGSLPSGLTLSGAVTRERRLRQAHIPSPLRRRTALLPRAAGPSPERRTTPWS